MMSEHLPWPTISPISYACWMRLIARLWFAPPLSMTGDSQNLLPAVERLMPWRVVTMRVPVESAPSTIPSIPIMRRPRESSRNQ